jgi:methanogenic corrinoid protein MtbC1
MMMTKEKQLGEAIHSSIDFLANEVVALQKQQRLDISPKYGLDDSKYREYSRHDLNRLAEALIANNPSQFTGYILWQRSMLKGHQVPDSFITLQLETEQTVLLRAFPAESHSILSRFLQSAKDALQEITAPIQSSPPDNAMLADLAAEYTRILLAGERTEANDLINMAVNKQVSIRDIYLGVFKPGLYEVGRMWQTGRITVAHEHYFTAATQFIMSEFYPAIQKHVTKTGRVAVAACVAGELHEIGLRMSADLLELEGWRTYYLGANMPAMSIIEIVREKNAQLLMLSMCLPLNGPALRSLISMAREQLGNAVKIIIGGYSISSDPVYAASFGADAAALDAGDAPDIAARLLGR